MIDPFGKNIPCVVSRYYRAPELILCITKYNMAIDIWGKKWFEKINILATGCIIAELITGDPLFLGSTDGDQLFAIFKILGSPSKEVLDYWSTLVPFNKDIFKSFLAYQKTDIRNKFKRIEDLDNLMDLLGKMFFYIPEKRIEAKEAMNHPFFKTVGLK